LRARHVCLVVAAALAVAASAVACRKSGPDWRILQLYSGQTSVDLLQHPANVQAFRLAPPGPVPKPGELHAGPYVAAAPAVSVPADVSAELSKILTDADTYDWRRGAKKDDFRPQVALWFVRGAYVLEIALDLETAQLAVYAGEQPLGVQAFDTARPRMVEIAKRLFPDDAVIRALK
jgi:hypothetical protein